MYILSDILVILLLMKFLWEEVSAHRITWPLFIIAFISLPFLMGFGRRTGNIVIRSGVSIAGFAIFIWVQMINGFSEIYMVIVLMGFGIYIMGSFSRKKYTSFLLAGIILVVMAYFLISRT